MDKGDSRPPGQKTPKAALSYCQGIGIRLADDLVTGPFMAMPGVRKLLDTRGSAGVIVDKSTQRLAR